MPNPISQQQLINKLYNLDIPDEELAQYMQVDKTNSTAFGPILRPNPKLVSSDGTEAAQALGFLNRIARWRRKKRYEKRIKGWQGTRIVSEGDSWFQYPFLLKDVIDHLSDLDQYQYAICSLGEAGDLLGDMVREDEISEALERENPQVFLISGGGNDMVGNGRMQHMVSIPDSGNPADYPNDQFDRFLDEIEAHYRQLFERILRDFPHLRIITHGYDYAIPDKGPWLGDPLGKAGISDKAVQAGIVAEMIDRFNERMSSIARQFRGAVNHVNVRGEVGSAGWHDELHPDSSHYGKVAALFDVAIQEALASESAAVPVTQVVPAGAPTVSTIGNVRQLGNADFDRLVYTRARACIGGEIEMPQSRHERRQLEQDLSQHFEKVHKEANFLPSSFLEQGVKRAHSVCRIVTETSYGSGFLIASRDFLMTNNHVIPNVDVARGTVAEFDYDEDNEEHHVQLDPDRLFITDSELDFTIVALAAHDLPAEITPIELRRNPHSVTRKERVNIVQHPQGRRKEVSLHDNKVGYVYDKVIRYSADTEPGSSGSPVFNNQWELVALHHAGWATDDGGAENEGVRLAAIVEHLLGDNAESSAITDLIPAPGDSGGPGGGNTRVVRGDDHGDGAGGNRVVIELPEKFGTLRVRLDG